MERIDWWFSLWEKQGKRSGLQYWGSRVDKQMLIDRLQRLEGDSVYITMMRNDFRAKDDNSPAFRVLIREHTPGAADMQAASNMSTRSSMNIPDDEVPF